LAIDLPIQQILEALSRLHIGVLGDLFLDRYLDIDGALTEPSIETGLEAYQVVGVRAYPGAAGTVINNLAALGVWRVSVLSVIGEDGEGFELRRELEERGVDVDYLLTTPERRTPTYAKPMLMETGKPARELNRLDIKNRRPMPIELTANILKHLAELWSQVDALIVVDQVSESECGVVTSAVRERLAELGAAVPGKLILADSRTRIGLFRNVLAKPNQAECRQATGIGELNLAVQTLAARTGRAVFCTCGEQGILLGEPTGKVKLVPGFPVTGPTDTVGAGDSTSAGIACALASGVSLEAAAVFGNLVASITVQQIGTTGTATQQQVIERWREVTTSSA